MANKNCKAPLIILALLAEYFDQNNGIAKIQEKSEPTGAHNH